jgi:glucose-1-phosphate cytidylyltransferase
MKCYNYYGCNEFIICCGYLGSKIREYFLNYAYQNSDLTIHPDGKVTLHKPDFEKWTVTLVDTGDETQTGGRIRRIAPYVADDPYFCMTYGDGVSDVNIADLIDYHARHGADATITAVRPLSRFGALKLRGDRVERFTEKPEDEGGLISGGFFVLSPRVIDLIKDDHVAFEHSPLEALARDGRLRAYRHSGFWHPMDTLRDKNHLENLWRTGAPWKVW